MDNSQPPGEPWPTRGVLNKEPPPPWPMDKPPRGRGTRKACQLTPGLRVGEICSSLKTLSPEANMLVHLPQERCSSPKHPSLEPSEALRLGNLLQERKEMKMTSSENTASQHALVHFPRDTSSSSSEPLEAKTLSHLPPKKKVTNSGYTASQHALINCRGRHLYLLWNHRKRKR